MKAGILTSGVDQDLELALKRISADGFRYAEIQYAWEREDGDRTTGQEARVQALLKQYGVRLTAVMRNLFSGMELMELTQETPAFKTELENFRQTIALARFHGCNLTRINSFKRHTVVFGYGGASQALTGGNAAWRRFLELMEPVLAIAEDTGIDVMMETGTGGFIHSAALLKRTIEALGSSRLKALWDPANCLYSGENPLQGYELLRGTLAEIHIKDLRFDQPLAQITYCPLGCGSMTPYLEPLAALLRKDRFDGAVVLENQVVFEGRPLEAGYAQSMPLFRNTFEPAS